MKRILVVLLFLAVASLGFSVTGSVYTRMLPSGYYYAEGWATTLQDLRVGRQGTGVTMNFDTFSLSYKLRPVLTGDGFGVVLGNFTALADPLAYNPGWAGEAANPGRAASSPGYLRLDGLKLGSIDLGIGGSWWTYGESQDIFSTNAAGATNKNIKGSVAYNEFAFDLTYNIQAGDFRIHADPWNKTFIAIYSGASSITSGANTNSAAVFGMNGTISCNIDYSMEALSLTVELKDFFGSVASADIQGASTNVVVNGNSEIGGVLKLGYVVNELVSVFGDVGLVLYGQNNSTINGSHTNLDTISGMQVPLLGGITLNPAPAFQVNLGLGYAMFMNYQEQVVDTTAGVTTTNTTFTDGRFQSEWDNYEMHGYHHPLIKFGADTKFAGDYSAGLRFIVQLNERHGAGGNGGNQDQNSHTLTSHNNNGDWLNFANIPDWDGLGGSSAYLGYDKDNFSCKLWTAGINTSGLLGMFGAIDVSIKF